MVPDSLATSLTVYNIAIHLLKLSLRSDLRLESSEKIEYDRFIELGEHIRLNQLSDACTFVIESGRDGNYLLRIHANKNRNHYGIIHGDLHQGNIVFHNGDPRPIDFGRCGFGYYLYIFMISPILFWGYTLHKES
ncbi:phosphotransferase [Brevibacillus formosus]|uniref:phosphotransferase n=1 Tax=Brevibacillus formosus TaxID=54913 RepID=UPI0027E57290|nr:phosphotransferase [Brevibacillus formosus]